MRSLRSRPALADGEVTCVFWFWVLILHVWILSSGGAGQNRSQKTDANRSKNNRPCCVTHECFTCSFSLTHIRCARKSWVEVLIPRLLQGSLASECQRLAVLY